MLKTSGTHEIEISWEPPKGDFTKYILSGEKYVSSLIENSLKGRFASVLLSSLFLYIRKPHTFLNKNTRNLLKILHWSLFKIQKNIKHFGSAVLTLF